MKFEVTPEQATMIKNWLHDEVYPVVVAEQKAATTNPSVFQTLCWEDGYPYEGACGGGLSYQFSPTGIGVVLIVTYWDGRFRKDVTDYDNW